MPSNTVTSSEEAVETGQETAKPRSQPGEIPLEGAIGSLSLEGCDQQEGSCPNQLPPLTKAGKGGGAYSAGEPGTRPPELRTGTRMSEPQAPPAPGWAAPLQRPQQKRPGCPTMDEAATPQSPLTLPGSSSSPPSVSLLKLTLEPDRCLLRLCARW